MPSNRKSRFKPLPMLDFQRRFATEEDCARFLFEKRWPQGWICPRCGHAKCYPIGGRRLYECARCRYQASLTAGAVLQGTRTPLRLWFMAIFLMVTDKRGISSVGLATQLGISQKQAWTMLHKLRKAMAVRNGLYKLDGAVELDESFFGAPKEGGCRGRGTAKKKVLAGLSLTDDGRPRYIRLRVLPRIDRAHLMPTASTSKLIWTSMPIATAAAIGPIRSSSAASSRWPPARPGRIGISPALSAPSAPVKMPSYWRHKYP